MRRLSISTTLALGMVTLVARASAELGGSDDLRPVLMNARIAEAKARRVSRPGTSSHVDNDTTWVGYNPAYAGSNYWSIGVGNRRPRGATGPGPGEVLPVPDADKG